MKGAFKIVLFAGVVAILGQMIRGCNTQVGWYEANGIELTVEGPLDESKFRWYLAEEFTMDDAGRILLPIKMTQLLYDSLLIKPFPRIEDNNNFVLVYDSTWVFPFSHNKIRGETQHIYEIRLFIKDSIPYADIVIDGPFYSSDMGPFISLSDSSAYHPQEAPEYGGSDRDVETVEDSDDPSVSTDYENR